MRRYQMRALHDVVQAGYVRYTGMSSCWAYQCMSCHHVLRVTMPLLTLLTLRRIIVQAMQSNTTFFDKNRIEPRLILTGAYRLRSQQ